MTPYQDLPSWFQALQDLRKELLEAHGRMRDSMEHRFDQVDEVTKEIAAKIERHGERLTVIETEREGEKEEAKKDGAKAGIVASLGLTVVLELFKAWFGKPH